jgi:hypothetical protein
MFLSVREASFLSPICAAWLEHSRALQLYECSAGMQPADVRYECAHMYLKFEALRATDLRVSGLGSICTAK